jgi:hypothetical protein
LINLNLIRAFEGPRHAALEAIWRRFAEAHKGKLRVYIFDNIGVPRRHDECLNCIWCEESQRPGEVAVLTEFDFLPFAELATAPSPGTAVEASEFCSRDPATLELLPTGRPGPWLVRINKGLLPGDAVLDFTAGPPTNDPASRLADGLSRSCGVPLRLLRNLDCLPRHYGTRVEDLGEHLFFSRHYNDRSLNARPGGIPICDVLPKVDQAIAEWRP